MTMSLTVIVIVIDLIKHVSIACFIQSCIILMECFLQSFWLCKFFMLATSTCIVDGGVNYDIIMSLLMKYYSKKH